jgi:pilus assembly protein CpaC
MKIIERFAKVVELKDRIARVDGFAPEILDVTGIQMYPNRVRVRALSAGVTTIVLVDENDVIHTVEVFVAGDVRHLQAFIDNMFPNDSIKAEQVGDAVVLRGWVTKPEHITHIVEISEQFFPSVLNQMQVGGAQQVQLKIRVMEVQRSKIRKLGFNFLHVDQSSYLVSTPGQLTPLAGLVAPFGGPPGVALNPQRFVDSTIAAGIVSDSSRFQGFLEALKQESLLKVLAEPKLNVGTVARHNCWLVVNSPFSCRKVSEQSPSNGGNSACAWKPSRTSWAVAEFVSNCSRKSAHAISRMPSP